MVTVARSMSRKLVYFDVNGLSESIRYLLHYGGLKFKDVRPVLTEWPALKESLPYGQLPIYKEDGRVLNQSMAIARYVAGQIGLLPSDPWEQAKLDAAVLNIYDLMKKIFDYYYDQDPARKETNKNLLDQATVFFFSRFEKELKAGNGYFGGQLSWADFILLGLVETYELYMSEHSLLKDYPTIAKLVSEIRALPGVKDYIAIRKPYDKP